MNIGVVRIILFIYCSDRERDPRHSLRIVLNYLKNK